MDWWQAYALTLGIELPVVVACFAALGWLRPLGVVRVVVAVLVANLTHPVLWLVRPRSPGGIVLAEAIVALVEGCWYVLVARRAGSGAPAAGALAVGVLANALSFGAGLLLAIPA